MSFPRNKTFTIAKADPTARRNTPQKELITEIVLGSCDHPTAETIYMRAKPQMPSVVMSTVYRNLGELVEEGKVREITVPNAPSRFDKTTKIHAHFVCSICGAVTDVEMDEEGTLALVKAKSQNEITEAEIIFRGVCAGCKSELALDSAKGETK